DFMGVCLDQIFNQAGKFRYMFGGRAVTPLVIRTMYGAGFRAASQHSQCLYPIFTHIPGLKVVIPSSAYEAKGLLIQAIRDDDPVIYVEHRLLHFQEGPVPDNPYTVPAGKARVAVEGSDITLVGVSHMQLECLRAQRYLESVGVHAEVIDPIWLSPLDGDTITESVRKTKRLLVVDNGWTNCGAGSEIVSLVTERLPYLGDIRVRRMGFAPVTCPPTPVLEQAIGLPAFVIRTGLVFKSSGTVWTGSPFSSNQVSPGSISGADGTSSARNTLWVSVRTSVGRSVNFLT
ncbi:MAG: hypothetical protein IH961_10735, partial [Chloroflexi bacterium]|nr:hypothetical protein [Chloroflexota bacterium]